MTRSARDSGPDLSLPYLLLKNFKLRHRQDREASQRVHVDCDLVPFLSSAYLCTSVISQLVDGRPLVKITPATSMVRILFLRLMCIIMCRGTRAAQEQSPLSHSQAHERATSIFNVSPVADVKR